MLVSNNSEKDQEKYLNLKTLELNKGYTKIAYVQDVREKTDRLNQGFFLFYLKDVNGDMITSRLFGVRSFVETGKLARMLKGQAVTVKFETQEFNGSLSIVLTSIDIYTGDFEFEKFIGKVNNLPAITSYLSHIEDIDLMSCSRLTEFYNGKVGGFALFAYLVSKQVRAYEVSDLADVKLLENTVDGLLPLLFSYYRKLEVQPVIDPTELIMDANASIMVSSLVMDTSVLVNVYLSCCGLCQPQFVESMIIYDIVNNVLNTMKIASISSTMTKGSLKQLEDGRILKKL